MMDIITYSKVSKVENGVGELTYYPKLQNEVTFVMERGEEYTLDDAGNYETDYSYTQYKDINQSTGEYVDSIYSSRYACNEYFAIPNPCRLFHYYQNQSVTAVSTFFYFYDENKTYLGASSIYSITSDNVNADTRGNLSGNYVPVPEGAKFFRATKTDGYMHILIITSDETSTVDKVNIPKLTGFVNESDEYYSKLQSEIVFENVQDGETAIEDDGVKNESLTYTTYHKIDVNSGAYTEVEISDWKACETYFEIPENAKLFLYHENQSFTSVSFNYCFYNESKTYLGRSTWVSISSSNIHSDTWDGHKGHMVTIPTNAKYYRLWTSTSGYWHALIIVPTYRPEVVIDHFISDYDNKKELKGLNILALGDSIWGNDRKDGVADFLAKYSGATIYNGAIGGTRITGDRTQYEAPAYKPFDAMNLVPALLSGTWTDQDATVDDVTSYVKSETLPMLKALDMSTIDVVILAYGHNDFTAPRSISSIQSALGEVISDILTEYPSIRIVVIAPPWRTFNNGEDDGDTYENSNNDTLKDIADAIVEKAHAVHITTLNMLEELPWRAETKTLYMDSDAVHPNTEGNKIYARVVNGKLRSMF